MAATESASSCGPQANAQPPPPIAQAPKPIGVMCRSELPSGRVVIAGASLSGRASADDDTPRPGRRLDPQVLLQVTINPESRVKVARGPAPAVLQQAGYVPAVVKVVNDSTVTKPLGVGSPQAGPVYSGAGRQSREPNADPRIVERFL